MADALVWPPKKEDLERLYLVEKLSASKIAKVYGLKYKNPKVAESTVLYQLRKNGIKRRDPAEHVRKVTSEIVDDWVGRYEKGESLGKIAGSLFSPVTVMLHLKKRGISRRNRLTAQISAVTKYRRFPFAGGKEFEAYLIGFARGDLNVSTHGRAVRVKTATTHPLMVTHLRNLFGPYGHVQVSPRCSKLAGYEWSVQVDLDSSFLFLMQYRKKLPGWILRKEFLLFFVAGFFDAEGSIWLNETTVFGFEISITNSDWHLLKTISSALARHGFPFHLGRVKGTNLWRLQMWQRDKVEAFLVAIPLLHTEKMAKARIALKLKNQTSAGNYTQVVDEWQELLQRIKSGRDDFVNSARIALGESGR